MLHFPRYQALPSRPPYFFFFNDTATTEIYTLSLHDALPIWFSTRIIPQPLLQMICEDRRRITQREVNRGRDQAEADVVVGRDRKSTRLNSSHVRISYAVFCLKEKSLLQVVERAVTDDPETLD